MTQVITSASIERSIITLRGQRVMLDDDLARLYGVPTKRLNEQVKRNLARFPADFMFLLTDAEAREMRSQHATASRRNVRHTPRAFTEQGVAMLASVLNSPRAVAVNIEIVRVFVRLRHAVLVSAELARRLDTLESSVNGQKVKNAKHFRMVFEALRQLMDEHEDRAADDAREPIGFKTP